MKESGLRRSTAGLIIATSAEDDSRTATTNGSRLVEADDVTGVMNTRIMLIEPQPNKSQYFGQQSATATVIYNDKLK